MGPLIVPCIADFWPISYEEFSTDQNPEDNISEKEMINKKKCH